jgi:hypothetical protein
MHKGHVKTGTVTGTGAAITIPLGFTPSAVVIHNRTDLSQYHWTKDMPAASAMKRVTAGTTSFITTGGISPFAGTEGAAVAGFTIGTDANINAAADVIYWEAYSEDA